MTSYVISEDYNLETTFYDQTLITETLFGVQGHYNYDREFSPSSPDYQAYIELLTDLGVSDLRFPGGTTTEYMFTQEAFELGLWTRNDAVEQNDGLTEYRFFLDDLTQVASQINATISIVLPTRTAFEQSAGQALISGSYGNRSETRAEYWERLEEFVDAAIFQARESGVTISVFEIGNEFWGGGEMSATEYGRLAAEVTIWLDEKLRAEGIDVDIAVQATSSTATFSDREGEFFLVQGVVEYNGQTDYEIFLTEAEAIEYISDQSFSPDTSPESLSINKVSLGDMPLYLDGVTAGLQTVNIANELLSTYNSDGITAAQLINGMILHPYFGQGFGDGSVGSGIDNENEFALIDVYEIFSTTLNREDLNFHATEWSARTANVETLEGLQSTIEAFFELSSNGVDFANYWPTTFGGVTPTDRVLIQTSQEELTFSGIAFDWLNESTQGLMPLFDYEIFSEIDIHTFSDSVDTDRKNIVSFVSDRTGSDRHDVNLDYGEFGISSDFFISVSTVDVSSAEILGSQGTVTIEYPVIENIDGFVYEFGEEETPTLSLDLSKFGTARIELTAITEDTDIIFGRGGNDLIEGRGGADSLYGGEGSDHIYGGDQADFIIAGEGDDFAYGGNGKDSIFLNDGNDTFIDSSQASVWGADFVDGGNGDDTILGRGGDDKFFGGNGDDEVHGGSGADEIWGWSGSDTLDGGAGDDTIFGDSKAKSSNGELADDVIFGGEGNDVINGGYGNDLLEGGSGFDTFVFDSESGDDHISDFESGIDQIDLSDWGVTSMSELEMSFVDDANRIAFEDNSISINGLLKEDDILFERSTIVKSDFLVDDGETSLYKFCSFETPIDL